MTADLLSGCIWGTKALIAILSVLLPFPASKAFDKSPQWCKQLGRNYLPVALLVALIMTKIEHRNFLPVVLLRAGALRTKFWIASTLRFPSVSVKQLAVAALHGFPITGLASKGITIVYAIWPPFLPSS